MTLPFSAIRLPYDKILDLIESETKERAFVTDDFYKGKERVFSKWTLRVGGIFRHFRTIYSIETVADIGDDGDWETCRNNTIRLWTRLEENGIAHWRALSGGKGTHTHIFLSVREYRRPFMTWATTERSIYDDEIECDQLLIDPEPGGRMVREFGTKHPKTGWSKTLWTKSSEELPHDRAKAYQMQPVTVPRELQVNYQPLGASNYEIVRALGGWCPQSFECLDSKTWCDDCPANR